MAAFQIFTQPSQQALDTAANVLSGATLTFSLTGTSTPTNAYSDSTLSTPVANPLAANAAGVWAPIFLDPTIAYRIVLKTQAGAVLQTWDPANENFLSLLLASLTQTIIGQILWPRTGLEIAASKTPINYSKFPSPWKDISRFVSDNTGAADVSTQLQTAFSSGEKSFVIPEGTYLLDGATSEIIVPDGVLIEGAGKWRSILKMGPNAGVGKAALRWSAFALGVHVRDFQILLQNAGKTQTGLRFAELRGSDIERIAVLGQGTAADDTIAILLDGTGTFTGGVTIAQCYLSNHLRAVDVQGVATDVMIRNMTLYGTALHATSRAVNVAGASSNGIIVECNSFNFWNRGVYSVCSGLKQIGNRFEDPNPQWEWVVGSATRHVSEGDTYIGGGVPIYSKTDADAHQVSADNFIAGQNLVNTRGYIEGNGTAARTFEMGRPQTSAGTFSASGAQTWNASGNILWQVTGKTMTVWWSKLNTTIAGTPSTALQILIPGSFQAGADAQQGGIQTQNNGAQAGIGLATVALASPTLIKVFLDIGGATNWTASAGNGGCAGQISFPVA